MPTLLAELLQRRSVRQYTDEPIPEEALQQVLLAGLASESSRGRRPWEFLVIREKATLMAMANCRVGAAKMLTEANCAIVVIADTEKSDVIIEDCAIAMAHMHLTASSLGLGSCWIQGRLRTAMDGTTTEDYLRNLLHFPKTYQLEAILSLGMPLQKPSAHTIEELDRSKIHYEGY